MSRRQHSVHWEKAVVSRGPQAIGTGAAIGEEESVCILQSCLDQSNQMLMF